MKEYIINALDSDGNVEDRPYPFQLEDSATVLSLKEAFEKKSVYTSDQFRLFYRKENGQNIGLDDEEQLDEIVRDSGQFLVQCPTLGALDGQISILRDFEEDVYILLGATKNFEHFHIRNMDGDNNLKLPKAKLNFIWAHNKVALIEQENKLDYVTYQYLVEDGWKLVICQNDQKVNPEDPTWILKRVEPSGERVCLEGKRKIYLDAKSKTPKIY